VIASLKSVLKHGCGDGSYTATLEFEHNFALAMKLLKTYSVNIVEFLTETGYMTPEIKRPGETK